MAFSMRVGGGGRVGVGAKLFGGFLEGVLYLCWRLRKRFLRLTLRVRRLFCPGGIVVLFRVCRESQSARCSLSFVQRCTYRSSAFHLPAPSSFNIASVFSSVRNSIFFVSVETVATLILSGNCRASGALAMDL